MSDFNPISGSILGSAQTQRQMEIEQQAPVRRAQAARRNAATREDVYDHTIESSDETDKDGKGAGQQPDKRQPPPGHDDDDATPHVDLIG